MHEYRVYVCDKCGKEFSDSLSKGLEGFNACLEHEKSHIEPLFYDAIREVRYHENSQYPHEITVRMTDEVKVKYIISQIFTEKESPQATANSTED